MDTHMINSLFGELLVYVQISYMHIDFEDDSAIVEATTNIVQNTIAPLHFECIIQGVDCCTLVFKSSDVVSAVEQVSTYCKYSDDLKYAKVSFSSQVVTYGNQLTRNFSHIYFDGTPED